MTCTADPDCILWRICVGPTGTVSWSQSGTGSVSFSSTTCTLSQNSNPVCSVTMAAATSGYVIITATYLGDSNNRGSTGTVKLTIKPAT
jgi:hypothetical protein